jgi:hypothetical protein
MKGFSAMFVAVATLAALVLSPVAADAQGRARGRVYTKIDVQRIISRVDAQSGSFRKAVDRQLDRSRLNGSRREDRINAQVKQYDRSVDDLRSEFSRRDRWMETRGNVERVLREASDVNRIMRETGFSANIEGDWLNLRRELNALAVVYNVQPLR